MENANLLETGGARDITWRECLSPEKWVTGDYKLHPQAVKRYRSIMIGTYLVESVTAIGLGVGFGNAGLGTESLVAAFGTMGGSFCHFGLNQHFWPNRAIKHLHEKAIEEMQNAATPKEEAMEALVLDGSNELHGIMWQKGKGIASLVKKVNATVLDKLSDKGTTLLEVAMRRHDEYHASQIEALLKAGADPYGNDGSAFVAAMKENQNSSAKKLLEHKATLSDEVKKKIASYCDSIGTYKLMKENIGVTVELITTLEKELALKVASSSTKEKIPLLKKQIILNQIIQSEGEQA